MCREEVQGARGILDQTIYLIINHFLRSGDRLYNMYNYIPSEAPIAYRLTKNTFAEVRYACHCYPTHHSNNSSCDHKRLQSSPLYTGMYQTCLLHLASSRSHVVIVGNILELKVRFLSESCLFVEDKHFVGKPAGELSPVSLCPSSTREVYSHQS